jgi:hypothetical protein
VHIFTFTRPVNDSRLDKQEMGTARSTDNRDIGSLNKVPGDLTSKDIVFP